MTIKVQCGCGTRYSFEVEPQNGAMPFRVNCPSCNADGTETANKIIAQTPVASEPVQPRLRMQAAVAPAAEAPAPPALPPPPQRTTERKAMRQLHTEARQARLIGWALVLVLLLVVAAAGAWGWFLLVGSKPRQAFSMTLTGSDSGWTSQFIEGGKILVAGSGHVTIRDVHTAKDLWSATLPGQADSDSRPPHVFVDKQDIWVCPGDQVVRLDQKTGEIKETIPITGAFASFTPTASNILVVSATGETSRVALQIDLASGESSSREITVPRAQKREMPDELPPNVQPTAGVLLAQATEEQKFNKPLDAVSSEFFSAGDNLVELRVTLLAPNVVWVKSIKPRGPSLIDGNTTAATSTRGVEEEVLNDIKRDQSGGVKSIDESRYQVRLRRWLGEKPVEWKGEVIGVPSFYALPTVDLLTAGKSLKVFDKQNNPLFETQISYPISERLATNHLAPAVERAGTLYFFDQGVLTAFALPGGQVQWRLTSVGISGAHFDDNGFMYIDTTAASPEDIQYSDQIKAVATPPVIMKVDPHSGKILWQVEKLGQRCCLSGKFVYGVSVNRGGAAMLVGLAEAVNAPRPEAPMYFHIHRLDPETGKELWDFFREESPEEVDFQQNWFFVRYGNDLQTWKFLSF